MRIINEAVKGNRNIFEYGDAALKQAILMLSCLESELTEEEKIELERQNKIYSIQSEINDLKSQLAETDYIVIKCQEYELAGKDLPDEYDIIKFSEERDSIRKQINVLEKELSEI